MDWWIGGSTCRGDREGVAQIQTVQPTGETFISYFPFFPHFEKKYMYKYFARFFVGSFSFMFFFCKLEYHLFITLLFRIWRIVTQTVICAIVFVKSDNFSFELRTRLQIEKWPFPDSLARNREPTHPTPPCSLNLGWKYDNWE